MNPVTSTAGASATESSDGDEGPSSADADASDSDPADTDGGSATTGDGSNTDSDSDSADAASGGSTSNDDGSGGTTASTTDEGGESSSSTGGLLVDGVLEINIIAHNDCTFTTDPESITVPEGTEFTVNWVSDPTSEVEFDIAKIDMFNQVPIVIGMEVGGSYHDEVREWCGDLFTGTFDFRLTSCFDPHYIPVDCGG